MNKCSQINYVLVISRRIINFLSLNSGLNPVCQSTWDTFVYKFNVTLSWTVSDIDTSQIDHFRITMFRYSDNTLVSPPESLFTIVDGQVFLYQV